jgi:hypothetical protein
LGSRKSHQRHQFGTDRGNAHIPPVNCNGSSASGEQVAPEGILMAEDLRQVFEHIQDLIVFLPNSQDLGNGVAGEHMHDSGMVRVAADELDHLCGVFHVHAQPVARDPRLGGEGLPGQVRAVELAQVAGHDSIMFDRPGSADVILRILHPEPHRTIRSFADLVTGRRGNVPTRQPV